jgi:hypothetical protein
MYLVSLGASMGGMVFVSSMRITAFAAGSILIRAASLYRLPGLRFQCCPSPWSIGSLTTFPSLRWKVS